MMAKRKRNNGPAEPAIPTPDDYFHRSERPLHALIFLLPLIAVYELGTLIYATRYEDIVTAQGVIHAAQTQHIKARLWLMSLFEWFGIGGYFLPGIIVIGALLGWHIARRDKWEFIPSLYGWMSLESLGWAIPLFVFGLVMSPTGPRPGMALDWLMTDPATLAGYAGNAAGASGGGVASGGMTWEAQIVFSVGAGIYEELLFRLVVITLVHTLLVDVLALPDLWSSVAALTASCVLFALYHFSQGNPFTWSYFGFYTIAGIYLASVFVFRAVGIAAGAHAIYDILAVSWRYLH